MSLLGRFLATSAPSVRFSLADLAAIAYGGSNAVSAGIAVTRETALTYGPWWRGVTLLAADCGKLPLYLYRHTPDGLGKDRDPAHMAYYLCRYEPNPHQTDFQFREQLTGHAVTRGNGYAYIERLGNGDPVALWPLDPSTVTPVRADGKVYYVVSQDGKDSKIDAEDVFHLRGFSDDGLVGYSVVERARESLGLAMAQRKHTAIYYRNNARPAVVLETPASLKPPAVTALREGWERMFSGLDNAHRTAVLDAGLTAKTLSFSAEDSQLIEGRQFEAREIALFLGIPPHKIGDPSATAYNSRESENQDYLDQGLDHWLVRWEGEFRKKLLTEQQKREETHSIEFLRAALLRGDMVARGNYFRIALGGVPWMTVNEVRGIENMNPEDGGDKLPQPLNMGNAGGGPGPDPGDSRKGKALPPPAPEPVALLELKAEQERDENGRFAGGGSSDEKTDEQVKADREKEDKAIEKARDKEDTKGLLQRNAEDKAVEQTRDKEDAAGQAVWDKEDGATELAREEEDHAIGEARRDEDEAVETQRQDDDNALEEARDAEDEKEPPSQEKSGQRVADDVATNQARDKEDRDRQDRRDAEDEARSERRAAEDKALGEKRDAANEVIVARREAEDRARDARREAEDAADQERREAEDRARQEGREKEDERRQKKDKGSAAVFIPNVKAMASLRLSLTSAAGRMVRRVGMQARKAACHHAKYQAWLDALVGEQTPVFADALASLAELAGHVRGLEIDGGAACVGLLCDLHDAYAALLDTATVKTLPAEADALAARLEAELPQSLLAELMGE